MDRTSFARRERSRSGAAAGLNSFPAARSHSHAVSGNYVGGSRPFRPSDHPNSVGRRLGNNSGALAWNQEPALPTGLHRRRDHHYPPPPPPPDMQGESRRSFHPQADLPHLRMLPEDGVAMLDLFVYLVGDLSESSSGLSEKSITNSLKTRICQKVVAEEEGDDDDDCCVICLEEYQNEEKIGFLDCRHEYHAHCLKEWLLRKNACPMCKAPAMTSP